MEELQNQSPNTADSSPPPANPADRLVPAPPCAGGRAVTDGVGDRGGGGEANSGYTDCDARHVVNLSEYNVCVQMGGHASIAQQSQGERKKRGTYVVRLYGPEHTRREIPSQHHFRLSFVTSICFCPMQYLRCCFPHQHWRRRMWRPDLVIFCRWQIRRRNTSRSRRRRRPTPKCHQCRSVRADRGEYKWMRASHAQK